MKTQVQKTTHEEAFTLNSNEVMIDKNVVKVV